MTTRPESNRAMLLCVAALGLTLMTACGTSPEPRVLSKAVGSEPAVQDTVETPSAPSTPSNVALYTHGPRGPLTVEDLLPIMGGEEAYVEGWEFVSYTDDLHIKLKFQVGNLGFGDHKGHFTGFVSRESDGRYWDIDKKYNSSSWKRGKGRFEIAGGPWKMTGEPGAFHIEGAAGDDGDLTFALDIAGTPWRPGTGTVRFGEEKEHYFITELMAVQGDMHGIVTIDGKAADVRGVTYAYHSGLNLPIHEMSDRIYHFREVNEDFMIEWRTYRTTKRYGHTDVGYLVVAHKGVVVFESHDLQLVPGPAFTDDDRHGYSIAKGMTLIAKDGENEARLVMGADELEVTDPLAMLPALERAVAEAIVQPVKYHQSGPWRLDLRVFGELATLEGDHVYSTVAFR